MLGPLLRLHIKGFVVPLCRWSLTWVCPRPYSITSYSVTRKSLHGMCVCMPYMAGNFRQEKIFARHLLVDFLPTMFFYWLHGNLNCINENLFHWYVMYICQRKSSCAWRKFFLWSFLAISFKFGVKNFVPTVVWCKYIVNLEIFV